MQDAYFALDEDATGGVHVQVVSAGVGTATMGSCIVNLCNTILGAGMLGLPHALGNSGWVLGMFLMGSMCYTAGFGLYLLAVCSHKAQGESEHNEPQSFYTLAKRTIPGYGPLIVDAAVAIKCFGVGTSYFIVIGDLVPEALEGISEHVSDPWDNRQFWIILYAFILCGPLILKKNLDALKFTSGAALGFVVFIVIVFLIFVSGAFDTCPNGFSDGHRCGTVEYNCKNDCSPTTAAPKGALDALEVFTIFIFGFTCHQNIFSVSNDLEHSTPSRVKSVIQVSLAPCAGFGDCLPRLQVSLSSCLVVYVLVAACGYMLYGQDVKSDVLKSFPQKNMLLILGTPAFAFTSFLICNIALWSVD